MIGLEGKNIKILPYPLDFFFLIYTVAIQIRDWIRLVLGTINLLLLYNSKLINPSLVYSCTAGSLN